MYRKIKWFLTGLTMLLMNAEIFSQQLKLGKNPYTIEKSAVLELQSDNQGLLFPRIADTIRISSMNPPDGMVIFHIPSLQLLLRTGGYWKPLTITSALNNFWSTSGNALTSYSLNFIGTTDLRSLYFRTNNIQRLLIDSLGNVGIGISPVFSATPSREKFLIDAGTTTSINALVAKGSIDSYLQLNIQNQSTGTFASSDIVATANNGSETSNFVNMGINGQNYSNGVMGTANDAYIFNLGQNFLIANGTASKSLIFMTGGTSLAANERMRIDGTGRLGIGTATPTAFLHLKAGTTTASSAPLKFVSGPLLATPEVGAVEYLTDKFYGTITTSAARKEFTLNDMSLTSGRIPFVTTNGRLKDTAIFSYSVNRLSPQYLTLAAGTATAGTAPLVMTPGVNLTVPVAGAIEFDGTHFYGTVGSIRYPFDQQAGTTYTGSNGISLVGNDFRNTLFTGIAGDQTVTAGTAAGNSLILSSTSNAAKGKITFGNSAYNETNNRLGIGNNNPGEALDITGNLKFTGALMPGNNAGTAGYFLTSAGAGASPTWSAFDTTSIAGFSLKVRSLFSAIAPITYSNGTIGITKATTSANGYLSSEDWNSFNTKLSTIDTTNINNFYQKSRSLISAGTGINYDAGTGVISSAINTGNFWSVGGNTVATVKNFGTIDNNDLPFITNNTEKMRLSSTGNLGIGGSNPSNKLSVYGSNPLFLSGVQTGSVGDSLLTISGGVVRKLDLQALASLAVTSVSATGTQGVTASVANPTTTPAITIGLGAITPTSVVASGSVTGSNLSGTNTGDQIISLTADVTGSGTGSFATTISPNVVSYSKMQQVSGTRILGNPTASTANASEITLGSGFSFTGSTLNYTPATSGTVSSVGLTLPDIFSVTVSPITTSGSLTAILAGQAANKIFAGPVSGANAVPAFRSLASADLPVATTTNLGGVSIGSGLTVSPAGALSTSFNLASLSASTPLIYNNTSGLISIPKATTSVDGYLAATDWTIFNNKLSSVSITGSPLFSTTALTVSAGAASGSLTLTTQAKNSFLSGPVTGANAAPAFRTLAPADLPIATTSLLGGVTVGSGLAVSPAGVLSATNTNGGTVTTVSASGTQGVTTSVSNAGTTPALTIGLGAITPTSVAASGSVTGSNLSGTNTGDQTISLTADVTGSGTGSFVTTISPNVVSYSKMQQVSGTRILGNPTASTANASEITLGSGFSFSGSTLNYTPATSGTVSSVGLTLPDIFSVTVSPITTSGSLTAILAGQAANKIFAGPVSGANAIPSFRSLVAGDLPVATTTTVGGVSIGSGLTVSPAGALSTSFNLASLSASTPLIYNNTSGLISIPKATTSVDGYLAATDWTIFNNKLSSVSITGSPLFSTTALTVSAGAASGSLTLTTQAKNSFLSGPVTGANAAPAFRTLAPADLPIATTSLLGGVTVGSGLAVSPAGVLSATNTNGGTVTTVSASGTQGVTTSVSNAGTTPALTIGLGAITPTSVAASGSVTGSNLSGTNTGDQTISLTADVTGSGTGSFVTTISPNVVSYSKMQQVSGTRILGNPTASTANASEITLGSGFSFSGSTLNYTPATSGTVSSVGLTLPDIFSVTVSPITTSGSLTAILAGQAANKIFAGPAGGAGTVPAFRSLVAADLPLATVSTVGGISVGAGLSISAAGILSNNFNLSNFSATAPLAYNNTTGVFSLPKATATANGYLSIADWATFNSKLSTIDTTNISNFYQKSRSLLSAGTGINYDAGTGVISSAINTNNFWSLGGNTVTSIKNLGTIDDNDLPFITNNTEKMRLSSLGNLGIGGSNPANKLSVFGSNPLYLSGVQTGSVGDSLLTISGGVVKKLNIQALASLAVTSVSASGTQGVTTSVSNANTTPAITIGLGAITPTSVAASGSVTGANLSGTNTGDQTISLTADVTGSGTGSIATTISPNAVSYAKMQQVTSNSLLGNPTALTANTSEITLGSGFSFSGSTLNFTPATSGTVSSVGLALPDIFSVTVSPITTSGSLTAILALQPANKIFAGSASGVDAAPSFRSLVAADLPLATTTAPGVVSAGAGLSVTAAGVLSTSFNLASLSGTAPLSYNNSSGAMSIPKATNAVNGYLASTDWTIFNNKVSSVSITGSPLFSTTALTVSAGAASGSLTLTQQVKNSFLSGPITGANAAPTFRTIAPADLPIATTSLLGGVSVGAGLTVSAAGVLSATNTNGGTVTTVAASGTQGVTTSVTNAGTTPAITIGLGAITPTSVAASGSVTGANLSGTNTGDQTISLTADVTGSGTGSITTTISPNVVSYAKMQQITASRLLGNPTASTANTSEITLGSGFSFSGSTLNYTPATSGTVSSVGLALPDIFSVTVSPITTSGSLTAILALQPANKIFAGSASGVDAAPSFRSLVAADLPLATTTAPGVVSAGAGLSVTAAGVLSTSFNLASLSGTAPLSYNNTSGAMSIPKATNAVNGYLASTDWTIFNNKVSSVSITGSPLFSTTALTVSAGAASGSLTLTQQVKNSFLSGPITGANTAPTFRTIAPADLPIATASLLGGVSIGAGLTVSAAGVLSATNTNGGTVTTVAASGTQGVTTSVTNAGTTPAITIGLGAITLTSVAASGSVTGANLSGTNTGDQTISLTADVTGSGTGSITTTISPNVVSYAKMQQVTSNSLLGNPTASTANTSEITLGSGFSFSGSTLNFTPATSGTVSSVGLVMPNIFSVTGSPVTATGSLTAALAVQTANRVFAGPVTGANAAPTFRALVAADLPVATTNTLGAVSIGSGLSINAGVLSTIVNGVAWNHGGNTVSSIKRLGTIDSVDLPIITNNTEKMRLTGTGYLGIGTSAPTSALDVVGAIEFSSALKPGNNAGASGEFLMSMGAVSPPVWFNADNLIQTQAWGLAGNGNIGSGNFLGTTNAMPVMFRTSNAERLRIDGSGKVGIGTTAPSQVLDVAGNLNVQGSIYTDGALTNTGTVYPGLVLGGASSGESISSKRTLGTNQYGIDFYTASNLRMTIFNGGNVGIGTGTTTPLDKLTVAGSIGPSSNAAYNLGNTTYRWSQVYATNGTINTSDRREKTNIATLTYGLKEVLALRPVSYNWKKTPGENKMLGLIAQEVKEIVPEVVVGDESKEMLGMKYTELIPVLINAIKEQQKQIDELKQQVKSLQK